MGRSKLRGALTAPWPLRKSDLQRVALTLADESEAVPAEASPPEPVVHGRVAVLPFRGVVLQHPKVYGEGPEGFVYTSLWGAVFDALVRDPSILAVVPAFHSPGGVVYGVRELAAKIRTARAVKPIIGVADSQAASAAYWIASACSKLYVSPGGEVGSVGVWTLHENIAGMMEQLGVEVTLISAGEHKVEGNPFEALDEEARAELQRGVDEVYTAFVADVALNRGVDEATVLADFGGGRMLSAARAAEAGMADGVRTLEEVVADLEAELGADAPSAVEGRAEVRAMPAPAARVEERNGGPVISGVGVPFGSESMDLGGWWEVFEAGAFAESLTLGDQYVAWQHDATRILGRVPKTARIWEDPGAMRYEARPPRATWALDAVESIRRGDVKGSSFRFLAEQQRWERRNGKDMRIVSKARLIEVGPQTNPAYPETSVAVEERKAWIAAGRPQGWTPEADKYYHRARVRAEELRAEREADRARDEVYRERARERGRQVAAEQARTRRLELAQGRVHGSPAWNRWCAAIHEAGHAVVAHAQGIDVRTAHRGELGEGHVTLHDQFSTPAFLLAGVAAVKLAAERGEVVAPVDPYAGAAGDVRHARRLLGGLHITDAAVQAAVGEAEGILGPRWDAVQAVAGALRSHGKVEERDLVALIEANTASLFEAAS